jgi:hypothetical protein
MHTDNLIVIGLFVILVVTFLILTKQYGFTFFVKASIAICIGYSLLLLYAYNFKTAGGSSLVWWFYLVIVLILHNVIHLAFIFKSIVQGYSTKKNFKNNL